MSVFYFVTKGNFFKKHVYSDTLWSDSLRDRSINVQGQLAKPKYFECLCNSATIVAKPAILFLMFWNSTQLQLTSLQILKWELEKVENEKI